MKVYCHMLLYLEWRLLALQPILCCEGRDDLPKSLSGACRHRPTLLPIFTSKE